MTVRNTAYQNDHYFATGVGTEDGVYYEPEKWPAILSAKLRPLQMVASIIPGIPKMPMCILPIALARLSSLSSAEQP